MKPSGHVQLTSTPLRDDDQAIDDGLLFVTAGRNRLHKFDVVDYFTSIDDQLTDDQKTDRMIDMSLRPEGNLIERFKRFIRDHFHPTLWLYLTLVGAVASFIGYWTDVIVQQLFDLRFMLSSSDHGVMLNWFIWISTGVFLAILSHLCIVFISQEARGSGIPEMKSILGGVILHQYLSLRALAARFIGTILSLASGLSVGKEGPFVHMASITAHQLSLLPPFSQVIASPGMHRQILAAAVAAGVTSTFGAPIGGTLFSIEVTATFFTVSSLWKTFFCSVMTVVFFECFHTIGLVDLFQETEFETFDFSWQLITFMILGVLTGLGSAVFIYLSAMWMKLLKTKTSFSWIYNGDLKLVAVVGFVTTFFTFWYFQQSDQQVINAMFDTEALTEWNMVSFPIFILFKTLLTSISMSLSLSAGIFTPIFSTGAVFGRWYGEILATMSKEVQPGAYAVAGAAGLTAGVTRTISTALIVFELTGQLHHLLPVLLVVLISYSLATSFTVSIYDLILRMKGLPYIPSLEVSSRKKTARDVMNSRMYPITFEATYADAANILEESTVFHIPVVGSLQTMDLICSIPRSKLQQLVDHRIQDYMRISLDPHTPGFIHPSGSSIPLSFDVSDGSERSVSDEEIGFERGLESHMNIPVDFSALSGFIDEAPFQVVSKTHIPKLHYMFTMLGLGQTFVVDRGVLQGTIVVDDLAPRSSQMGSTEPIF